MYWETIYLYYRRVIRTTPDRAGEERSESVSFAGVLNDSLWMPLVVCSGGAVNWAHFWAVSTLRRGFARRGGSPTSVW